MTEQVCAISIGDYLADFYKGALPYIQSGEQPFNIPGIWSLYLIYFFAIIGRTVSDMLSLREHQAAIRCVTRRKWFWRWNLKIVKETFNYCVVTYLTFFTYSLCTGAKISGAYTRIQYEFNGLDLSGFSEIEFFLAVVAVPFCVMLTLAYIQYVLSLGINVIVGLVVSIAVLVSSVFRMSPLLVGNYMMLMRYDKVLSGGVNIVPGIVFCAVVIAAGSIAGEKIIRKKDIF